MDVASYYSEFLSIFISLIIAGVAVKLALAEKSDKTYNINGKLYSGEKVHTAAMLGLLGIIIQVVSDSMKILDGRSLLLDEKILAAYAVAIMVMAFKK